MDRGIALQQVAELTEARRLAASELEHRDREWREGIKAALAAGCARGEIAAEAEISRQRVWQIGEGTR